MTMDFGTIQYIKLQTNDKDILKKYLAIVSGSEANAELVSNLMFRATKNISTVETTGDGYGRKYNAPIVTKPGGDIAIDNSVGGISKQKINLTNSTESDGSTQDAGSGEGSASGDGPSLDGDGDPDDDI